MVWNASGEARVKSYRIYQELETKHNEALERIKELEKAIGFKDGLIRSLAAEVAMLPKAPTQADLETLFEGAADVQARSRTGSGIRPAVRPGAYSSADGTSEDDDPPAGGAPEAPLDSLGHIPSPKRRKHS